MDFAIFFQLFQQPQLRNIAVHSYANIGEYLSIFQKAFLDPREHLLQLVHEVTDVIRRDIHSLGSLGEGL